MHELSIAHNLVEIAGKAALEANIAYVDTVNLRLGALAGVDKNALLFGYDIVTQNTPLEGSRLNIKELPVIIYCSQCQSQTVLPDIYRFSCPHCGGTTQIVQGKELEIVSLEYSV